MGGKQASKGATQKYGATQLQASAEHMRLGATQRYSTVSATYSAQKPIAQLSQLASVAHSRIGTQGPQQDPLTEGTSPGTHVGVGELHSTAFGLQLVAPLPPDAVVVVAPPLALAVALFVALVDAPAPALPSVEAFPPQASTAIPKKTQVARRSMRPSLALPGL